MKSFPKNRNASERYSRWVQRRVGAAKAYARIAGVSPALAEKRRQGAPPQLDELAAVTRAHGLAWAIEAFRDEIEFHVKQQEARAERAQQEAQHLRALVALADRDREVDRLAN